MDTIYIYTLSDPISSEIKYVGKSINIKNRYMQHIKNCKKEHTLKCEWVKSLLDKGLKPKIFVIDELMYDDWQFWEKYWISQLKTWGFNLLNSTEGGDGVTYHSELTKKNISEKKKGVKIHTEEHKLSLSERMKGNTYTLGKKLSEDHKKKISMSNLGKKHTEETKKNISEKNKGKNNGMCGKKHNKESLKKISERSKGEKHPMVKLKESDVLLIKKYYKNKIYNQKEIAKIFGVSYSLITKINKGLLWSHL